MPAPHHLVLVGAMGVGKSTVGALLAGQLGRPLVDSDAVLAAAGDSAAAIARRDGVAALHARECDLLLGALADPEPAVVAAAASVVERPACRAALGRVFVAWLRASPARLVARGAGAAHRRELGRDPVAAVAALERHRAPLYREVADVTVDVDGLAPPEVARAVTAAFATAQRGGRGLAPGRGG
ncbi:MAG TPA: shikimate kinase [Acidimicrobiales bacterium]